jgi:hypothetical protein
MSWKKETLVRMGIKLPTCGTLLNMPLQLDFVERLIFNQEEHKKVVLLCERPFIAGIPSHTMNEISKSCSYLPIFQVLTILCLLKKS